MVDAHQEAINAVFDVRRVCMAAVHEIERIAKAMGILGLREAADQLCDATFAIDQATEKATAAYAASVSQRVVDTERATGNMIAAFVAGVGANGVPLMADVVESMRKALEFLEGCDPSLTSGGHKNQSLREEIRARLSQAGAGGGVVEAAKAGWNACRKSVYAVCEDVATENEQHREDTENPPRHHFGRGGMAAAKSIARGFNSMEAEDDDNFTAALAALASSPSAGERPHGEVMDELDHAYRLEQETPEGGAVKKERVR